MSQIPASAAPAIDPQNPWLGLASFTEETRAFFHGRDEEVAELGRRVQRKLLTILFGQSGLGKTSILRAGIVPRLRPDGYCPVYVRLDYGKESPPPAQQIKDAILRATREAGHWTQTGIAQEGESLWEFLHHRDDLLRDRTGRKLIPLLIFDQFEEVFTLAQGDDFGRQRAALFLEELADLVENRAPRALEARLEADEAGMERFDFGRADYRILIALREDYLAHLEGLKNAMPSVTQNRMRLARMTGAQALAAVTRPGAGLVSEEVARSIVRFVAGGAELERAEVEPSLLSLVCRELNETRRTKGHAEISGDLLAGSRDTILTEFYERTLADQPAGVRAFIEDELLTDSGYRESIAEERVNKGFIAAGAGAESLATLIDRRLLRVEERLDVRRVELTHDVLVGVVKASRDVRQARERTEAIERQLAETRAKEAATQRSLWQARLIATVCAVLAVGAIASAIFGYLNLRRARAAEVAAQASARRALENEKLAFASRAEAERVVNFLVVDLVQDLLPVGRLGLLANLYRQALAYYDRLPPGLVTPDTLINQAIGNARAAWISSQLDLPAEADERVTKAIAALAAAGTRGDPDKTAEARAEILFTQAGIADQAQQDYNTSEELCRKALAVLDPLLSRPNPSVEARRLGARATWILGFSLTRNGNPEAVTILDRSAALARSLLVDDENKERAESWIATAVAYGAYAASRAGLRDQVEARAKEGVILNTKIRAGDPTNGWVLDVLSVSYRELAKTYRDQGKLLDAADADRRRADVDEAMLKIDPTNRGTNNNVMIGRFYDSYTSLRQGEISAALSALAETASTDVSSKSSAGFNKGNLLRLRAARTEVLAAVAGERGARDELAGVETLAKDLIAMQRPESPGCTLAIERLSSVQRSVALASGDFNRVRDSAHKSLTALAALPPSGGTVETSRLLMRRNAQHALAQAATEQGNWAEAEAVFRTELSEARTSGEQANRIVASAGIVSSLSAEFSAEAWQMELQTWLAWVCAHQLGKADEALILAKAVVDYQRRQLARGDGSDQATRLAEGFALVALARAQADGGDKANARSVLNEAEKILASLSDEFRVTSWVKRVQAKLEETRALVR